MKQFSPKKLREVRKAAGIGNSQVSEALGVHTQTVFKWENGRAVPKLRYLGPLADALGVEIGDLFEETDA